MNDQQNIRRFAAGSRELEAALEMRNLGALAAIGIVFCTVFVLALLAPAQEGSPAAQLAATAEACAGACVEGE